MTSAIAVFLRIYDHSPAAGDDGTRLKWQNFFVEKTIDGFLFEPFDVSDITINRTADEGGLTMQMPALALHLDFFLNSIEADRLAEVWIYEMDVASSMPTDISGAVLVARFVGEIISLSTDLTEIQLELGASIDAVSGEIPGRRVTTSVVGRLPTL